MTDRKTNYFGELIPETDNLQSQQFAMTGHGYQAQAFLGTGTVVDGFTCTPTTPASLNVQLSPGTIYSIEPVEATTWSSLPANTTETILKQGIMHTTDTIGITPPSTVGFSQVFLIEAQYADLDTTPVLLPYFNASNPAQPYQGPNNSGQSQNTARLGIAAIQVKAGTAASTGTQVAPTPDAGWTGLFLITVANGTPTITSGNITAYAPSSFIPVGAKLPQLPFSIQNSLWTAFPDSGTADALYIAPAPAPAAWATNMLFIVKKGPSSNATTTPTLNIIGSSANFLGAKSIVRRDGSAVSAGDLPANAELFFFYDGTSVRVIGMSASDVVTASSLSGRTQVFTSSGTFNVPNGVTQVEVWIWGGGGAGGASADGTSGSLAGNCGAGGGGGGFAYKRSVSVTPLGTVAVTVGAAGAPAADASGGSGGTSSFGSSVTATGGIGGSTGINTGTGVGGNGGSGSGGDLNISGGTGGSSGDNSSSTPTQSQILSIYNKGGMAPMGAGTVNFGGTGAAGSGFAAGGTGASGGSGVAGGAGAPGLVIVRW